MTTAVNYILMLTNVFQKELFKGVSIGMLTLTVILVQKKRTPKVILIA